MKIQVSHIPITERTCGKCNNRLLVSDGEVEIKDKKPNHTNCPQ